MMPVGARWQRGGRWAGRKLKTAPFLSPLPLQKSCGRRWRDTVIIIFYTVFACVCVLHVPNPRKGLNWPPHALERNDFLRIGICKIALPFVSDLCCSKKKNTKARFRLRMATRERHNISGPKLGTTRGSSQKENKRRLALLHSSAVNVPNEMQARCMG